MQYLPKNRAFTLIEMLTALSILAILLAISLPATHYFSLRSQDTTLQQTILSAIEFAKTESQARHAQIGICKSNNQTFCEGDWENGLLIFLDENNDGVIRDPQQIVFTTHNKFSSSASTQHGKTYWRAYPRYRDYLAVNFSSSGLMRSDNGRFWHCHESSPQNKVMWAIFINQIGKTRVVYPDKNGEIFDGQGQRLSCGEKRK